MPEFSWHALNPQGQEVSGRTTAHTQKELLTQLQRQGLAVLLIDASGHHETRHFGNSAQQGLAGGKSAGLLAGKPLRKGRLQPADIFHFTSELAIMLKSGLALDNALRLLGEMASKSTMAQLVHQITDAVKNGAPLSKALGAHPQLFDDFYLNMVRSGEASGQLASVLERVLEHMERQRTLRDSVVSAAIYPLILLIVAALSLVAMLGFVVPQFENLFNDLGDALPLPTKIVVGIGHLFSRHWPIMIIVTALVVMIVIGWGKSASGREQRHRLLLRLPVIGPIAYKYQLSLFARTLGNLIGNGVPLLQAVQIATDTVSNTHIRAALMPLSERLKSGARISQTFRDLQVFDPLAVNLIKVGEETGRLGPMLLELARLFSRDVENGIKRSLTLLEPVLILVLGGLIAAIIVSILLGILSVNDLAL
jgi:general secretion pathway protein F